jgi:FkbM family methyltransferase
MDDVFKTDYDADAIEKVSVKRFGFEFYVTPRFASFFADAVFEELTSLLIRQNARGIGTFIDVGAHYGFYDVLVGLTNPQCKILAFEPVAANVEVVRRNLALSQVDAEVFPCAVSDRSGRAAFQISEASDNSGFNANPNAKILKTIEIETVQLDQYVDRIAAGPVLVKIDTEGNELKVLDGMRKIVERFDDVRLVIEFNPRCIRANGTTPETLLDTIEQLGFDVFFLRDREKRYERYRPGADWRELMGETEYGNVFCLKKTRSLNLCVFSHMATLGGAERSLAEIVDRLTAERGSIFTVAMPSDGPLRTLLEDLGAATMIIDYGWWCGDTLPPPLEIAQSMGMSWLNVIGRVPAIERIDPDVVLSTTLASPWGAVLAEAINRPHVWWVTEFGEPTLQFFLPFQRCLDIIGESSNCVIVNSKAVRDALFATAGTDRCVVATNNVALQPAETTAQAFFRHPTSVKLLISGSVTRLKGQDDAVYAAAKLLDRGYDVELSVLGPTHTAFAQGLMEFVRSERLENRIHFWGFVDNVRPAIEQADIGLSCSMSEAFGRTTVEAMMLGKPVIGTRTGGTVGLIEDGVNGFLYPPGDVNQLVEKLIVLLDCPEKIREFGGRARESADKTLLENPADDIIYEKCLQAKGAANPHASKLLRSAVRWQQNAIQVVETRHKQDLQTIADRDQKIQAMKAAAAEREARIAQCEQETSAIRNSTTWKLASLVRRALAKLRL